MSNKEISSFAATCVFSLVASALAAWVICAMAPTKPRGTPLLVPERRGVQINHAAATVTSVVVQFEKYTVGSMEKALLGQAFECFKARNARDFLGSEVMP